MISSGWEGKPGARFGVCGRGHGTGPRKKPTKAAEPARAGFSSATDPRAKRPRGGKRATASRRRRKRRLEEGVAAAKRRRADGAGHWGAHNHRRGIGEGGLQMSGPLLVAGGMNRWRRVGLGCGWLRDGSGGKIRRFSMKTRPGIESCCGSLRRVVMGDLLVVWMVVLVADRGTVYPVRMVGSTKLHSGV